MANQTVTKTPDYWRGANWSSSNVSSTYIPIPYGTAAAYRVLRSPAATVTACSLKARFTSPAPGGTATIDIVCTAYGKKGSATVWAAQQVFSFSYRQDADHTFSFGSLSGEVDAIEFWIQLADGQFYPTTDINVTAPTASYTYTPPTLGLSVTPGSLYVGETITCNIQETFGQTFDVRFSYGSTTLQSLRTSAAKFTQTANASWFSAAGVTGSSMRVNVTISDSIGRTASGSVTVNKHTALVPSITAPKGGSYNGGQTITFAWSSSGDGTQTGAQLQWSKDNISWSTLASVSGSGTQWTAPAGKFPAGTVYWRLRLTNSHNLTSGWVTASFTAAYTAAAVTLTAPTSGTRDGGQKIDFAWTIAKGSGTVSGTQMDYSTDGGVTWTNLVNSTASVTSYSAAAGKFKGGSLMWRVRAKDSYAGWSAYKTATITISYTPATVTLTTPTSGSWDGAETITFGWTITKGSGTVTGTQMQISTDDGLTWTNLLDSDKSVTTYSAGVAQFPAGKLLWRVRAKDSYSGYVDNWKQATITVTYSAVSQVEAVNSPTSGVYNAAAARTFEVRLNASGPVYAPFQIQEATFCWRSGETGEFTELTMTPGGNTASVEIPAGTFPSGRIEWYASATDTTGRTTETPHYVLAALQTDVEAAPLSPINTIESGSGPILFRWTYGSLDGSPQGRAQLQYSRDGETWTEEHVFADITGDGTSFLAEQGTFPGGTVFWRVRSYNDAGTAGPWSQAVSFSSYSAPLVTGVTGDGRPFSTITWQADGQEAYEIEVDGKTYGPYYGANVRTFTLQEPLPDGNYTIRVRAQNKMTLWSQWVEGQMSVVNVPGDRVAIARWYDDGTIQWNATPPLVIVQQPQDYRGSIGIFKLSFKIWNETKNTCILYWRLPGSAEFVPVPDEYVTTIALMGTYWNIKFPTGVNTAEVQFVAYNSVSRITSRIATWTRAMSNTGYQEPLLKGEWAAEYGYILVYRDGKRIARSTFVRYTDRVAVGTHEYYIIQVIPGGYYTKSSSVTVTIKIDCPAIAPLSGGDFLSLKLSVNAEREVRITEAREVAWTQYAGAEYPSAEIGEGKSKAVALDVSALMSDEDFAKAFTALLGQDVIVKTPDGTVAIGPLESLDLRAPRSHRSWTFGVTQMEWSDFIDES